MNELETPYAKIIVGLNELVNARDKMRDEGRLCDEHFDDICESIRGIDRWSDIIHGIILEMNHKGEKL